jgi:hypothetical protein
MIIADRNKERLRMFSLYEGNGIFRYRPSVLMPVFILIIQYFIIRQPIRRKLIFMLGAAKRCNIPLLSQKSRQMLAVVVQPPALPGEAKHAVLMRILTGH